MTRPGLDTFLQRRQLRVQCLLDKASEKRNTRLSVYNVLRPSLIATIQLPGAALEDEARLVAGREVEGLDLVVGGLGVEVGISASSLTRRPNSATRYARVEDGKVQATIEGAQTFGFSHCIYQPETINIWIDIGFNFLLVLTSLIPEQNKARSTTSTVTQHPLQWSCNVL